MMSYLLLPRRGDVVKWLILPIGFLVGSVTREIPSVDAITEAVVIWVCLELLVYQARYQWNDIRGFEADQVHPDGDRGRLPGPLDRRRARVGWSATIAAVKVLAAASVCFLVDVRTGWMIVLLTLAVFGLAAVYETLRGTSTGRTDVVPSPISLGIMGIWLVVGAGYALRAVTGLGLAVDLRHPSLLILSSVATCWFFGIAWVTSRWAVEATAFAELRNGQLSWHASTEHAREHQLALVRWLSPPTHLDPRGLKNWTAVRGPAPISAPWAVAGALAGGSAAVAGVLLVEPTARPGLLFLSLVLGSLGIVALLVAGHGRELATAGLAALIAGASLLTGEAEPVLATVPWVCIAVAQACYLRQDRASLGGFLRGLGRRRSRGPAASARAAAGRGTRA